MIKISDTIIREIDARISASERVVIPSHINPDGDSIGSMLGLYWYLSNRGVNVNLMVPNEIPFFLHWMPGCDSIVIGERSMETVSGIFKDTDLIFCLDFNELARLNMLQEEFQRSDAFKILIGYYFFGSC